MTRTLYRRLAPALKAAGTYDPSRVMPFIEETLTLAQSRQLEGFLRWVHDNGRSFGSGNYQAVYAEFVRQQEQNG